MVRKWEEGAGGFFLDCMAPDRAMCPGTRAQGSFTLEKRLAEKTAHGSKPRSLRMNTVPTAVLQSYTFTFLTLGLLSGKNSGRK